MGHAVWHTAAAMRVLVATLLEVPYYAALRFAALRLSVQIRNIAEGMLRVIRQCLLVVQHIVMLSNLFQASEEFDVAARLTWLVKRLSQVLPRVYERLKAEIFALALLMGFHVAVREQVLLALRLLLRFVLLLFE